MLYDAGMSETVVKQPPTTVDDYLALSYAFEVIHNEDGYFARVVELPGCMTWTDEAADLWPMIEDAMRAWIGASLEEGDPVPVPDVSASETVRRRMPEELHQRVQRRASADGVTIEQFVTRTLATAVGA